MPVLEDNQVTSRGFTPGRADVQTPAEVGFFEDIVPTAFRLENTIGSILHRQSFGDDEADLNFDPIGHVPPGLEEFAGRYRGANSIMEVDRITEAIENEQADKQMLADAGFDGFAATMLAGIFDPVNLIPVGGAAYRTYRTGGSILENGYLTARAGFLGMAASEAVLQETQMARTAGETTMNVAAGTFLAGILGSSVGAFRVGAAGFQGRTLDDLIPDVERDLTVDAGVGAQRQGATQQELETLAETLGVKVDELTPEQIGKLELEREGIKRNTAVDAAMKVVGKQDPTLRLLSSASRAARAVVQDLAETPLVLGKNEIGEATPRSVERLTRNWQSNLYRGLKGLDDQFVRYSTGHGARFGSVVRAEIGNRRSGKLTGRQFREEVGKAMRRGDEHEIPEVAAAARHIRKEVFEPLKEEAIAAKLLPEDVDPVTAVSYLNRVYNLEKLATNRTQFIDTTSEWLMRRARDAEERTATFKGRRQEVRDAMKSLKAQRAAVEKAAADAAAKSMMENATAAVNDALQRVAPVDLPAAKARTEADAKKSAEAAARKKERETLAAELEKAAREAADAAAKEVSDDVIESILNESAQAAAKSGDDVGSVFAFLKEEVPPPIGDAVGPRAGAASRDALANAQAKAAEAARKEFEKALKRRLEKLSKQRADETLEQQMKRIQREIRREVRESAQAAARAAAKEAGKEFAEQMRAAAKKLMDIEQQQRRDEFNANTSELDAIDIAEQIAARIEGTPAGRLPYDVTVPGSRRRGQNDPALSRPLKGRAFLIEDELIEDFLENDVEVLAKLFIRGVAPDVEITKKFGDLEMTDAIDNIRREHEPRIQAAKGRKASEAAIRARDADIRDILAVRDRIRGVYGMPADPKALNTRIGRFVRQLNYTRLLGGMTLSAIPDLARVVMVHGFNRAFHDALVPMVRNWSTFKANARQLRDMGAATDMVMNSRAKALADVEDDFGRYTKLERMQGAMNDTFGMVSLMAPWNTALKQIVGMVSQSRMLRAMQAEANGKIGKRELEYLRSAGINADDARAILKQFEEHGGIEDGVYAPNANAWTDREAYVAFQSAINRDVDRIIVTPGQDLPLAATGNWGEIGRMAFQFKSFAIASTQRMLLSGLQQRDMAALNGLMLSTALGMVSYAVKQKDAGNEISDDPLVWLREGVDRSGVTGWMFEANNMLEKATRGTVGISALTGGPPMSRYASRNMIGAILGPTAGTISGLTSVVQNASVAAMGDEPLKASDIHAARRLLPYNNLLVFRQLVDQAEEGIAKSLGAR